MGLPASCPPTCKEIQILQLLRLEIGAIYVTTFPPYLCSMFAGGRDRQRQRAFANLFEILSQRRAVFVSVFPLILWPTGSETDHSPQPLQVKMEPIMRAPFGEVVLPITELIRVGAKVDGTSFRLRRWG